MTKKLSPVERAMKVIDLDKKGKNGLHFTERFVAVRDGQKFTSAQITAAFTANVKKNRTAKTIKKERGLTATLARFDYYQRRAAPIWRAKLDRELAGASDVLPKARRPAAPGGIEATL